MLEQGDYDQLRDIMECAASQVADGLSYQRDRQERLRQYSFAIFLRILSTEWPAARGEANARTACLLAAAFEESYREYFELDRIRDDEAPE